MNNRKGKRIPTSVRRNRFVKALSAFTLSAVLILQMLPLSFEANAATSATSNTSVVVDDLIVSIDKTLVELGSRSYRLTIEADSHIKDTYRTVSQKMSSNGVYVIEESGYYLFELWGGKGGDGDNFGSNFGGAGGSAGYVYGYKYLEAGQSIVFTSGTNGILDKSHNGGENQGGSTVATLVGVGGGGGYSAVYLFDSVKTSSSITEAERLSNYILIAGGGGGGGAANGELYEDQQTGRPNGGNGGSILSSASAHLSGNDNNGVAGTYYAGTNGKSSGSRTNNVGKGGTNIPGSITSTLIYTVTRLPQDWTGTYQDSWYATHTDSDGNYYTKSAPGSGGNGLARGGSGGAGFAGGSGGSQTALLIPTNVGGGGGGSSFVSDEVISQNLPSEVSKYLEGVNGNPSTVGGSCVITYLGGSTSSVDTTHMQSVEMTTNLSKYFDVLSISNKNTLTNETNGTLVYDEATGSIRITGMNIAPDEDGNLANTLKLDIILRAKSEFAGGNMVPVITESVVFTPVGHDLIEAKADNTTDYCNVPLNFKAIARSYTSNEPGKSYPLTALYTDNYEEDRTHVASMWQYDFISSIGTYTVQTSSGGTISTTSVAPTVTTNYRVRLSATVKSTTSSATVGTRISSATNYFYDTATIRIVQADAAGSLNGLDLDATKMLNHDGTQYDFTVDVNQKTGSTFVPEGTTVTTTGDGAWTVPKDGWYYVQAWGANGGNSGKATARAYNNPNTRYTSSGGWTGGAGGYTTGYVYLEEGDLVFYNVGSVGSSSSSNEGTISSGTYSGVAITTAGGGGGGYSYVGYQKSGESDITYLVIAGGGGGAGGAAAARITYFSETAAGSAANGYASTAFTDSTEDMSVFNGGSGSRGSASYEARFLVHNVSASSGARGSGGKNFKDSRTADGYDTTGTGQTLSETAKVNAVRNASSVKSGTNGKIAVTFIENAETRALAELLFGLEAEGTFSRYFNVKDIELTTVATSDTETRSAVTNADGSVTVTYTDNGTQTAKYTYRVTENADATSTVQISDMTFSPKQLMQSTTFEGNAGYDVSFESGLGLHVLLTPKEGFLGGNDVPLLQYEESGADDTGFRVGQSGEWLWLAEKEISDFANVAIPAILDETILDAQDVTITCGESVDQATQMITVNVNPLDTVAETWKKEFVTYVGPTTSTVAPRVTTDYTFTGTLKPVADATKAEVISTVEDVTYSTIGTVYVNHTVTYDLTHLEHVGPSIVEAGASLSAQIAPESGYLLPNTITVRIGSVTLAASNYTYNNTTGEITIPASGITDNVTITAVAQIPTYHIYYTYENADGDTIETEENTTFPAGAAVTSADLTVYNAIVAGVTEKTGYTYTWEWSTDDGQPVATMPARDVYVNGYYSANPYNVTVHYLKAADGTEAAPDHTEVVRFNEEYNIVSPHVPGYFPQTPVVTGTVTTPEDVGITVLYEEAGGYLTIFYLYGDTETEVDFGEGIDNPYKQAISIGDEYSVASPEIAGYTPDTAVVSGTVDGDDVDNGIVVTVRYMPNRITVTFDVNDGTLNSGELTRTVVYNDVYAFDPTKPDGEQYNELPDVFRTGYEFLGWFDENDVEVTEETVVLRTDDHTLTAKWDAGSYRLTVHYNYADGQVAAPDYSELVKFGQDYNIPSPVIEGYTPEPDVIGTMGAGNKVVYVVYGINSHTVKINLIGPDGTTPLANCYNGNQTTTTTTWQNYSATLNYGSSVTRSLPVMGSTNYRTNTYLWYSGLIPDDEKNAEVYEKYFTGKKYASTVTSSSTISLTVPDEDVEINVYYKYIDYTLTVNFTSADATFVAPEPITETIHYMVDFSVDAPNVTGFTASSVSPSVTNFATTKQITGRSTSTASDTARNLTYTVTYTRNSYVLTVDYKYSTDASVPEELRGTTAAPTVTQTVGYGDAYSVASPEIDGYTPSQTAVSGTMGDENTTVTVIYSSLTDLYSIDVTWGTLTFDYNPGVWDPETHSYTAGTSTLTPRTDPNTNELQNKVTVSSSADTSGNVKLSYTYAPVAGYEEFTAAFYRSADKSGPQLEEGVDTVLLVPNDAQSTYLFLEGESNDVHTGQQYKVGTCTVTIEKAQ